MQLDQASELANIYDAVAMGRGLDWHRDMASVFSPWVGYDQCLTEWFRKRHEQRNIAPYRDWCGVYLLSASTSATKQDAPADWLNDQVLYVGYAGVLGLRWKKIGAAYRRWVKDGTRTTHPAGWGLAERGLVGSPSELHVAAIGVFVPGLKTTMADLPVSQALAKTIEQYIVARILSHRVQLESDAPLLNRR